MKRRWISALTPLGLILPLLAFAGEAGKVGIVKGTITIAGRPTSDAVVSVEGLAQEQLRTQNSKLRTFKAEMDQRDMKFIPRVLPVTIGTSVDFPNNDKTFHNVFSTSEAKKFDLGLYPPGKSRSVVFDKSGVVKILCNVHPNMEAFIVVKSHPYFSSVDNAGNYRINFVPLGRYRLQVWHPEFGTSEASIELVREGEVLDINFDLKK